MATRAEIRKKLGIVTLEDPSVANKELSEKDALEYENFMKSLLDFNSIPTIRYFFNSVKS